MFEWPCIYRTTPTGETFDCGCGLGPQEIFKCDNPALGGKCVVRMGKTGVKEPKSCGRCNFREEPTTPRPAVIRDVADLTATSKVERLTPRGSRMRPRTHRVRAGNDCENPPRPEKPFGREVVRHLAYHVYPAKGNGVWQRNVEQVLNRIDLFNGRRIVAIATGPNLDAPESVQEAFGGKVDEFIVLPNDKRLREVVTFLPLLERVASLAPNECTFYAHAKGATHPVNDGVTVHRWTDLMYETLLDHWPFVEDLLLQYPLAGSFKKVGRGFVSSASTWHYSGTFYWLRNSEVFSRDWRRVDQHWWGTESWPGIHFSPAEAGCVFVQGTVPSLDLYNHEFFHAGVLPAYEQWKASR